MRQSVETIFGKVNTEEVWVSEMAMVERCVAPNCNFANPQPLQQHRKSGRRVMAEHTNAHPGETLVGLTRDPVLRPVGALLVIVGSLWLLFWGMAIDAGSYGEPLSAMVLIFLGLVAAGLGMPEEQV
jgi:hypothetical protein